MAKLLDIKAIMNMLDATTMSHEDKKDFLKRLDRLQEWTPELAEEFGQAILSSLKTYEADMAVYTATMEAKQNELDELEKNWKKEYKTLVKQQYPEFQKVKAQTDKAIALANKQIDKFVFDTSVSDLGSLLQDIYK